MSVELIVIETERRNGPQALQRLFGPSGPCGGCASASGKTCHQQRRRTLRHSGESTVPQSRQTKSPSSTLGFYSHGMRDEVS
mgnify:CR=1 FL=1